MFRDQLLYLGAVGTFGRLFGMFGGLSMCLEGHQYVQRVSEMPSYHSESPDKVLLCHMQYGHQELPAVGPVLLDINPQALDFGLGSSLH